MPDRFEERNPSKRHSDRPPSVEHPFAPGEAAVKQPILRVRVDEDARPSWRPGQMLSFEQRTKVIVQGERFAASVWRSHRDIVDAPHWLGLPQSHEEEEAELPLRYGMVAGDVSGNMYWRDAPDNILQQGDAQGFAGAESGVIRFPKTVVTNASSALTRSRLGEVVVPFRALAHQETTAIFSLSGGTGRTTLATGLARILAGQGKRVLLADSCPHSSLAHHFGGKDARQGKLRHFAPTAGGKTNKVSMISLTVEPFAGDILEQQRIMEEFTRSAARVDSILWDLSGAPAEWTQRVLSRSSQILVPLLPSASALMQLAATEKFLQGCNRQNAAMRWKYVLNRFEEGDPGHREMRGRFQQQLGDRLLPLTLRNSLVVDEALARGRTVVDHAPGAPLVADLARLAHFLADPNGGLQTAPMIPVTSIWREE